MENKRYYLEVIEKDNNEKLQSRYNLFKVNDKREDFLSISKNINCFIGANNSGKSRALRQILCPVKFELDVENTSSTLKDLRRIMNDLIHNYKVVEIDLGIDNLSDNDSILSMKKVIEIKDKVEDKFDSFSEKMNELIEIINITSMDSGQMKRLDAQNKISRLKLNINNTTPLPIIEGQGVTLDQLDGEDTKKNIENYISNIKTYLNQWIISEVFNIAKFKKIYIPTLRSVRPLNTEKDDLFKNRTIADYNLYNVDVFTGLDLYGRIQNMLLGYKKDRDNIGAFESFLSKNFFDGHDISLTTPKDKDVVHIKIGEEKEHEIYHVGDGIQQLIILLFPFFENRGKRDITICIEEPELFLHPKWQRIFIDTISQEEFENIHVFFTTHSNAFINHEAVDVYQIKKEIHVNYNGSLRYDGTVNYGVGQYNIANICGPILTDKKELLAELGYQASDVLGHNYTLLVEGPSDKIFIERFISTYSNDKLQIDNHYNVLPFHGKGNLKKHYGIDNEPINLEKLNHNFGIVVDSDLNHTETNTLKNKLNSINKFFWCTHGRSIENTIPRKIWIKALVEDEQVIYYDNNKKIDDLTKVNCFEEERYSKINEKKYSDVKSILNSLSITLTQEQSSILDNKITENNKLKKGFFRSDDSKILQVDKVKIAHQVTSNYPANKEELLQSPELAYYIPKLCKAIYKANGMIEEANAISDEDLETAKKALEEAIEAEDKKVKQAISGHQPKQQQNIIESKIDEELKP